MATTLFDTQLLNFAALIFAVLLVFVITYGFLSKTKLFGEKNGLYGIVSLGLALMVLASAEVRGIVLFMMPWLFVVIFIAFFVIITLMIFGLKEEKLLAGESVELRWTVLIILIILFMFAAGNVFGQSSLEQSSDGTTVSTEPSEVRPAPTNVSRSVATDDFSTNVWNTFINPQILGFIAVMLIGMFAIILLTRTNI